MLMTALIVTVMMGCSNTKDINSDLVRHPDAPMLILSGSGNIKVAIYDARTKTLVPHGTINISNFEGWTITKFDWEKYDKED
ncbi:hypothetical protein N8457_00210 [bacterium]|nr:hypothetical protein [bacterium]